MASEASAGGSQFNRVNMVGCRSNSGNRVRSHGTLTHVISGFYRESLWVPCGASLSPPNEAPTNCRVRYSVVDQNFVKTMLERSYL